jgi:hypothetical protein
MRDEAPAVGRRDRNDDAALAKHFVTAAGGRENLAQSLVDLPVVRREPTAELGHDGAVREHGATAHIGMDQARIGVDEKHAG